MDWSASLVHIRALTFNLCHGRQQHPHVHSKAIENQLFLRGIEMTFRRRLSVRVQELYLIPLGRTECAMRRIVHDKVPAALTHPVVSIALSLGPACMPMRSAGGTTFAGSTCHLILAR